MLGEILRQFTPPTSERLLVGIDGVDDAGVYKLTDDTALVLTVDFFPPIVDDPFTFGQVAAANALSDVYAMGGRPIAALNILTVPPGMAASVIGEVLRGGAERIAAAGAVIAGGHTIKDTELKYGLAVTGLIHPDKIVTNGGAQIGDRLILTKPLGTGLVATSVKQNRATPEEIEALTTTMTALNREASEAMVRFGAHAATDITGFGLVGHGGEMARASKVSLQISFRSLKLLPGAERYARTGITTGGGNANRQHWENRVTFDPALDRAVQEIFYDPQTSGGLLIALPEKPAEELIALLQSQGVEAFMIGEVVPQSEIIITVLP